MPQFPITIASPVLRTDFANHGAWVSSVAKQNHGHDTAGAATAATHGKSKHK